MTDHLVVADRFLVMIVCIGLTTWGGLIGYCIGSALGKKKESRRRNEQ
jgi:membrane protein YqaA with SNARE-associated domain